MGLFSKFGKNKQEAAQDSGYYTSADDQVAGERARAKRAASVDAGSRARRGKERETDDPVLPEKKRARRRLVGAIALAQGVAIGLPMVLDSEPKPLASDIDIKIPAKDKLSDTAAAAPVAASASLDSKEEIVDDVKPAQPAMPAKPTKPAVAEASAIATPAPAPVTAPAPTLAKTAPPPAIAPLQIDSAKSDAGKREAELKAEARAKAEAIAKNKADNEAKARLEAEARLETERKQAEQKAEAKAKAEAEHKLAEAKALRAAESAKPAAAATSEDARALAILEGKSAAKPAAAETAQKFVLQVAALSDQTKVDELRDKLKKAGISSYTQKTPSGEITRVRVGPFTNKEEAEKVRAKLTAMGLSGRLETV